MRAFVYDQYGLPEVLRLQEVPKPSPGSNEVLVKIKAVSVNDWDWSLVRGKPFVIRMMHGIRKPSINTPGVDIAGEVEAVGPRVTRLKPGDKVYGDLSECGFGGFAEYVCAPESHLSVKPTTLSFAEASAMPHAALLAYQGLIRDGKIRPGHKVLINGAGGGVGSLGIQIAAMYDAEVDGVDSNDKFGMMQSLGFNNLIDYKKEDFTRSGRQYDIILDTKTNRPAFHYARALKKEGKYITVGGDMNRLLSVLVSGSMLPAFSRKKLKVLNLKPNKGLASITHMAEEGKLKPLIDGPYPFEEIPRLVQYFGDGLHKGKVVIETGA